MAQNQYNFNVQAHPEILEAYQQAANNIIASQQQGFENKMALYKSIANSTSQLVQSFVEQAKYRQQKDAVQALADFNPNQPVTKAIESTVPGPESAGPGTLPGTTYQQTTLGQTPEGQDLKRQLLARVLASNPKAATEAITKQAYPAPPTTLMGVAARDYTQTGQIPQSVITANQEMQKLPNSQKQPVLLDGSSAMVNYVPGRGTIPGQYMDDKGNVIDSSRVKPIPPSGSAIADVRLKGMTQQNLTGMVKDFQNVIINSPVGKTVAAADNFLNQVNRTKDGTVVLDKSTANAMTSELDRVLAGQGLISEQRAKELLPQSLASKWGNIQQYVTSHPQDQGTQEFFNNLAKEVQGQREIKANELEQALGPIFASATLAQQNDLQGYNKTLKSIGVDPDEAAQGHIKFLPGANSLLYGQGKSATGITQANDSLDAVAKLLNLKKKGS